MSDGRFRQFLCGPGVLVNILRLSVWCTLLICGVIGTIFLVLGASDYQKFDGVVYPTTCRVESTQMVTSTCQTCYKNSCTTYTCYQGYIIITCCGYCRRDFELRSVRSLFLTFVFAVCAGQDKEFKFVAAPRRRRRAVVCKAMREHRLCLVCIAWKMG